MIFILSFVIFCGGILGFLALPDPEAGIRMLTFSTVFLIAGFSIEWLWRWLARQFRLRTRPRRAPWKPHGADNDFDPNRHSPASAGSDWRMDPATQWQYRLNDQRLGRLD